MIDTLHAAQGAVARQNRGAWRRRACTVSALETLHGAIWRLQTTGLPRSRS